MATPINARRRRRVPRRAGMIGDDEDKSTISKARQFESRRR
jgi:hypothetical protein